MPDIFDTIAVNIDIWTMVFSLMMVGSLMVIGLKKGKSPIYIIMLMFVLNMMIYVAHANVNPVFAMILLTMPISAMVTYMMNINFLGTFGSENKIFMSYIIFYSTNFFLLSFINLSTNLFYSPISSQSASSFTSGCSLGFFVVDGIINCAFNIINRFLALFSFSTSVGIINVVLLIPFAYFMLKYVADYIRGKSS